MIPGTYHYAVPHDTITLNIGTVHGSASEPATLGLLGLGLAVVIRRRRRSRKGSAGGSSRPPPVVAL